MSTPSLDGGNGQPGRGPDGRFLHGNRLATGNPHLGHLERFRSMLLDAAEPRLPKIVEALLSAAEAGERWAVVETLDRVLGKPAQAVSVEAVGGAPLRPPIILHRTPEQEQAKREWRAMMEQEEAWLTGQGDAGNRSRSSSEHRGDD